MLYLVMIFSHFSFVMLALFPFALLEASVEESWIQVIGLRYQTQHCAWSGHGLWILSLVGLCPSVPCSTLMCFFLGVRLGCGVGKIWERDLYEWRLFGNDSDWFSRQCWTKLSPGCCHAVLFFAGRRAVCTWVQVLRSTAEPPQTLLAIWVNLQYGYLTVYG